VDALALPARRGRPSRGRWVVPRVMPAPWPSDTGPA
jgi:hypothetical protein